LDAHNERQAEDIMKSNTDRFSGHESFLCRYGWLPKAYSAVKTDSTLLRNEESAMNVLGIDGTW
jgi:hypothetical protein